MILKNLKKNYLTKKSFIVPWVAKRLLAKNMNEYVFNVWNKYEMKTKKDYHDLYLKYEVFILADVFEKFRNNSLKNYGLFQSHYLSTPV